MRFNINRPLNCTWVDDVPIQLSTSALPADVLRVQWRDQEGFVWYVNKALNTKITDPSPYQVYINNWMTACIPGTPDAPPLSIAEAKQIKVYLIEAVFNVKRQAPFPYTVTAGALSWDAADSATAAMSVMMVPVLYSLTSGLAAEGGETSNSLVAQINNRLASLATKIDANFASDLTSAIVSVGNSLITFINTWLVAPVSTGLYSENPGATPPAGIGFHIDPTTLVFASAPASLPTVAVPPIDGSTVVPPDESIQWHPIGQAAPVTLTVSEMTGLMAGIAARRTNLLTTKTNKIAAVNALTSITAVIAYDATAGW